VDPAVTATDTAIGQTRKSLGEERERTLTNYGGGHRVSAAGRSTFSTHPAHGKQPTAGSSNSVTAAGWVR
jgi:hypothetical protein